MEQIISFFNQIDLVDFILEPEFKGVLLVVKLLFIVISSILIGGILAFLSTTTWFRHRYSESAVEFKSFKTFDAKKAIEKWAKINKKVKTSEYKLAVVEASSLLGDTFSRKGYIGESMEDLLNKINEKIIPSIQEAREAYKMSHKTDLSQKEAKDIVEVFEKAFEELESF